MPRAQSYEADLVRPLSRAPFEVTPVWIRLESHVYSSSDRDHIRARYCPYGSASAAGPLDGLILTGAPVEELPYDRVTYWAELSEILAHAQGAVRSTLGLCWGGLALARRLGLEKRAFERKLFGVFQNRNLAPEEGLLAGGDDRFWCAQSRHSGIDDGVLERARAAGLVRLLSHAPDTGYSIFASPDDRLVMHLGHPEYEPARLVEEWRRDVELGRTDVQAPRNLDLLAPSNTWRSHCTGFFGRWLGLLAGARARAAQTF
jgi:homoserine O-succinyltransferase